MSANPFTVALQAPPPAQTDAQRGPKVHIETPHLVTRSMTAADVTPEFARWFDDPRMLEGLNLPALNFSLDGLRAFVAGFDNRHHFLIGIFGKGDGPLLGFYNFSVNARHRVAMLTLGASPHIKNGRAVFWESWFPLCDEMFERRGIDKISSRVLASNRRLLFALMGTVHFVHEATLKQEILAAGGQRLDVMVLSCFKDLRLRPHGGVVDPAFMPSFHD
jgi:RimJ/RimL family protein N-acetyltransferase